MANRQVGKKVFDWAAIMARVPVSARAEVASLRASYSSVQAALSDTSAEPSAIDWAHHKSVINAPGFVDTIKAEFDAIKIEYPADTLSSQIDQEQKAAEAAAKNVIASAESRIAELEAQLAAIRAEKPLDEVTVDEYLADKPEWQRQFKAEIAEHKYY
eukprot:TRINITY_DN12510_c3_g1_i6.p1 TRINITY_DN12510_c3_g1~~TRINITY_DN12510_c3_g1_i6.p1  ORF type:complete len:158 (+),score=52.44 TRINITY_DN12510_c3_g1_i6:2-475(+)